MALIPTRSKGKISHLLSYPIGAKRISLALAAVPQYRELVLHFQGDWLDRIRYPRYPYLMVAYSEVYKAWNPEDAAGVTLFNVWDITVKPVRRGSRHKIQQHMLDSALPQAAAWLSERAGLHMRGREWLIFFYDEDTEEFSEEREAKLEPARTK